MTPERWQPIDKLLEAALQLEPDRRAEFLEQACAGDEGLRREVELLLAADEHAGTFIDTPPAEAVLELLAYNQSTAMLGRTLGHYQILSLLGAGGMGEVYRASDTRLAREVAIKILPENLATSPEALKRFEREAKAVAALSHPNILAIHDFGTEQGIGFAVMELLEGETLRAWLAGAPLAWRKSVEVAAHVAEGLAAAHARRIVHRDLKPENIFLTEDGQVKILDFGIARMEPKVTAQDPGIESKSTERTEAGVVMGTIGYMSPEQVRGEETDATSDIFSFGCVLYEMVAGQRPFARETAAETMAAVLRDEPPAVGELRKGIPRELERVILHCLEKKPRDRYQAGRDLAFDLRGILSGSDISQPALPLSTLRIRPAIWIGVALAIVLIGISLMLYLISGGGKRIESVAVLPLVNTSADANAEYLSDGITESIINSLSQLPELRVMARSTVFSYKDTQVDPRQVGRDLNVGAVLTGRITQRDDRLLIRTELVNVADGSQLWGEQYDRTLSDVLAVQAEIARQVSEKLRLRLTGEEQKRLTKRYTENTDAYQLYIRGRYYLGKFNEEGFKKGLEFFRQAIDIDPAYALAYAGQADAYYWMSDLYLQPKEAMPKARAAAMKALEIDETLAEGHATLAVVKSQYDWEWAEAEREYKRAIDLKPGYASAHWMYGLYLVLMGRPEEALVELKQAQGLDPLSTFIAVTTVWPYHYASPSARKPDRAIEELRKIIAMDPNVHQAHAQLGMAYEQKGMYQEAIAEFDKAWQLDNSLGILLAWLGHACAAAGQGDRARGVLSELHVRSRQQHVTAYSRAILYSGLGENDQAIAWLEKAYEDREEYMVFIKVEPAFDNLRSDPRFAKLLQVMRLAP